MISLNKEKLYRGDCMDKTKFLITLSVATLALLLSETNCCKEFVEEMKDKM